MSNRHDQHLETLAQADLLLLIGRLLAPPGTVPRADLSWDDGELNELLVGAGFGDEAELNGHLSATMAEAQRLDDTDWSHEYNGLFEGSIPCPINESAYIRRDKGAILGDICGFYRAFGFRLDDRAAEKPDHLRAELEFVAMLLVMRALAEQRGDPSAVETTSGALAAFARDHIGEWLDLFCDRLAGLTSLPMYRRLAETVRLGWRALVDRRGLPRPAEPAAVAPETDDRATPYECGMAEAERAATLSVGGRPIAMP